MKLKLIIASLTLVTSVMVFIACSKQHDTLEVKNDNPVIQRFLDSKTFRNHQGFIESLGSISYGAIKELPITISAYEKASMFIMPVEKNGRRIGYVEIVDLKKEGFLPNGDSYGLNYVDMNAFDIGSKSGKVQMMDLNYDNYVHTTVQIRENKITSWESTGLSAAIALKYKHLNKGGETARTTVESIGNEKKINRAAIYTLCDTNHNNNISFGECYNCVRDAIEADGFSNWICDFPGIGWFSCWYSTTATCMVISARY